MASAFDTLAAKIRSIGEVDCENQMYCWPGFDPTKHNPKTFFKKLGVKFDGYLFIRYPVKKTFQPLTQDQLDQQERALGIALPVDYRQLLLQFGPVHLPGRAVIIIESPLEALESSRGWCKGDTPLSVLAISTYWQTSDGNSIGFLRSGDAFLPEVYEFDHELVWHEDDPRLWTRKRGNSLADFLLDYLANQP